MALTNTLIDGWVPDPRIEAWAKEHGFGKARPMSETELRKLAKTRNGRPSGLYLWEGSDHGIYVGISTGSVVTRLRAHVRDYPQANIQAFRYLPGGKKADILRAAERGMIHEALWEKFTCYNTEHSSQSYGNSPFDDRISPERQAVWFADPAVANKGSMPIPHPIIATELARSNKRFPEFKHREDSDKIIDAISLYLRCCVPYPYETQVEYWGISCLPNMKADGIRRVSTLSMAMIEMLWFNEDAQGHVTVNVGTDYLYLAPLRNERAVRKLGGELWGLVHGSGGANEEVIHFKDLDSFIGAMQDSQPIRVAAARFARDRMRKSRLSGKFRDSHNFLLAEKALEGTYKWKIKSKPLKSLYTDDLLD